MTRIGLNIKGQVQGVGFRPFIYKLANELSLNGFVKNNSFGVEIQIEGKKEDIEKFSNNLLCDLPPLAKIVSIKTTKLTPLYKGQFEIINSSTEHDIGKIASVPPDNAICKECLFDLFFLNNQNNYFKYFATNCTNCGPRYSIIQTVPYDRANTSMKKFSLCKICEDNYNNPLNRRYHAQPISCNNCGPKLNLIIKNKTIQTNTIYKDIASLISNGKIGAIKGMGGFHIVCDATNNNVIKKLREYKNRPTKPFAIMCKDIDMVKGISNISIKEQEIISSKEAPIVIIQINKKLNYLSPFVAPNIKKIGVMISYTGLHHLLFEHLENPIVATSANLNGESIITKYEDIEKKLPFIDFIVDYNRDIVNAVDDSVVQIVNNELLIMRLARGYAPKEIILPFKINKNILAVGANQKNSICLAFDNKIIIGPYIGDLDSVDSLDFFYRTIKTFKKFYDFEPDIIIHDKHPNYETTKWAKEQNKPIFEVQHHLSHIYSVKAQYNLTGDYIGFAFDGTGYGDDKTLWGGEIFIGDTRKYNFKQIKLLGGEKSIKEPRRVALSMLFDNCSLEEVLKLDIATIKSFSKSEIELLYHAYSKDLNSINCSSVGRLFDAITSFSDLCQYQSYEGETGIYCETSYNYKIQEYFEYEIKHGIIDIKIVDFIIKYQTLKDKTVYSTMFINTLAQIIIDIAQKENLPVILSGGVFQNKVLLELVCKKLQSLNIEYYYNTTTSINDGGISLGQIYYYLNNIN